jgi:hypothetical protein
LLLRVNQIRFYAVLNDIFTILRIMVAMLIEVVQEYLILADIVAFLRGINSI